MTFVGLHCHQGCHQSLSTINKTGSSRRGASITCSFFTWLLFRMTSWVPLIVFVAVLFPTLEEQSCHQAHWCPCQPQSYPLFSCFLLRACKLYWKWEDMADVEGFGHFWALNIEKNFNPFWFKEARRILYFIVKFWPKCVINVVLKLFFSWNE